MIAPYREWWWEEVLYQGNNTPDTKEELIERVAEKEQITEFSARWIVIGARKDGIIQFAHDGYPEYNGLDVADPSEEPEYVRNARQLSRDGIVRLGDSDVMAHSAPILVQRASASSSRPVIPQLEGGFRTHTDDLAEYIQMVTRVDENRAKRVFEENDTFVVDGGIVKSVVITDDMEGISIISEY